MSFRSERVIHRPIWTYLLKKWALGLKLKQILRETTRMFRYTSALLVSLVSLVSLGIVGCSGAFPAKTVIVVRHAEKAVSEGSDPELSDAGKVRAERLSEILSKANITHVYTTKYKRTQATALQVATAHHLKLEVYDDVPALIKALKSPESHDGAVLVVGHSNTVPEIVELLSGKKTSPISDGEFGNLFVVPLSKDNATLLHLSY